MKCPCCQLPLEPQSIAVVHFDVCHACLGVWLPNQALKGIVASRAMTTSQLMTRLQETISQIEEDAYTDALTGLRNRRFFDRQLYAELARARGANFLSLVLLDLDGFKTANDTHGHATGDLVLKRFGELLLGIIRKNDCVARVGGDEFGIILPETDAAGARAIADRIVDETAAHSFTTVENAPLRESIHVSCGLASYPVDLAGAISVDREAADDPFAIEATLTRLFDLADAALYAAKDRGKSRTVSAGALTEDERSRRVTVLRKRPEV